MNDLVEQLGKSFSDSQEYRAGYAESFMNSWVAAQIRVLREQRGLSQQELAEILGTKQAGISRLENTNYSAWKVQTLARLARAFDVRLRISFEEFGTLPEELDKFGREFLKRDSYCDDAVFQGRPASIADQLSDKERRALHPQSEGAVEMKKNKNLFGSVEQDGNGNASNLNTSSQSLSLSRGRGVEPAWKSVDAKLDSGTGQPMQVYEEALRA